MHPFQVYARVRPLNEKETDFFGGRKAVSILDNQTLEVGDQDYRETHFQLDSIFGEEAQNQEIFEEAVRPLADNFLNGINSTVLAYGITGAGKSFTMFGKNNDYCHKPGLIELAIEYICQNLAGERDTRLTLSYMEIYNEQVFDLLRHNSESLQIIDDPVVGVIANDLEQIPIVDTETALKCIAQGNQRRVVAETKANQFSSRSHAIVQLSIEKRVGESVFVAKLSLVDLAGSQKQSVYSQNKGIRNLEGSNINKSLLTLGNCITILSSKKGYVPYRDSKLTRLLKDSLGGNTRTSMIACISPSMMALQQTINTMKYACRARKIEKSVHQNIREPRTVQEFKRELAKLRREIDVGKTQGAKNCSLSREQMQQMLQKLIKNVQNITLVRVQCSSNLQEKMKQVELIDQQRAIVNGILSRFQEDSKEAQDRFLVIKHSESEKMIRPKNKQNLCNSKQSEYLERISEEIENTTIMPKPKHSNIQKNLFEASKLQNRRLKYRQIRNTLKDLVFLYHSNYQIEQFRLHQMNRAAQLRNQTDILVPQQKKVYEKILCGLRLNSSDLTLFHIERSESITEHCELKQFSPHKNGGNRFMSSLQQIRKMMRKLNNRSEPLSMLNQNQYEQGEYVQMGQGGGQCLFNNY